MPKTGIYKNLTNQERVHVVLFLLENSFHGMLSNNLVDEACAFFN
jgi:septin family protein